MAAIAVRGVIPPLVTPINRDETVNFHQLKQVIDHLIDGGVDAIFLNGSTGEFARFPGETREIILAEAVKITAKRVPVYAGVGDAGLELVKRNIRWAEQAGADALVASLPYYFPAGNDEEVCPFFQAAAESTSLPMMLYNIPSTTGASISLAAIERLLPIDNIVGIKDSSGDLPRLVETIRRFKGGKKDFAVLIGSEELAYDGLKAGADGLVPSMANPFPRLWADIWRAAQTGDDAELRRLCDWADAMNRDNHYADAWFTALVWRKKAMAHLGVCNDFCTAPYIPVPPEADERVRASVAQYLDAYGPVTV